MTEKSFTPNDIKLFIEKKSYAKKYYLNINYKKKINKEFKDDF